MNLQFASESKSKIKKIKLDRMDDDNYIVYISNAENLVTTLILFPDGTKCFEHEVGFENFNVCVYNKKIILRYIPDKTLLIYKDLIINTNSGDLIIYNTTEIYKSRFYCVNIFKYKNFLIGLSGHRNTEIINLDLSVSFVLMGKFNGIINNDIIVTVINDGFLIYFFGDLSGKPVQLRGNFLEIFNDILVIVYDDIKLNIFQLIF